VPDSDQPVGIVEWQRLEQDAADHAENRGVCTDAQRERENGDRSEEWSVEEPAGDPA
jgi:hypothetical protein